MALSEAEEMRSGDDFSFSVRDLAFSLLLALRMVIVSLLYFTLHTSRSFTGGYMKIDGWVYMGVPLRNAYAGVLRFADERVS